MFSTAPLSSNSSLPLLLRRPVFSSVSLIRRFSSPRLIFSSIHQSVFAGWHLPRARFTFTGRERFLLSWLYLPFILLLLTSYFYSSTYVYALVLFFLLSVVFCSFTPFFLLFCSFTPFFLLFYSSSHFYSFPLLRISIPFKSYFSSWLAKDLCFHLSRSFYSLLDASYYLFTWYNHPMLTILFLIFLSTTTKATTRNICY